MIRQCKTVKPGNECVHWQKNDQCGYGNGTCYEIVEQCEGCNHVEKVNDKPFCQVYAEPAHMWLNDMCPFATHVKVEIKSTEAKINPLKASKRAAAGR